MAKLKPRFFLIGSVAEGTRLEYGSEVDVTVQFQSSLHEFTLGADATELICNPRDTTLLKKFLKKGNIFDYPKFLLSFLDAIENALFKIQTEKKIPSLSNFVLNDVSNDSCQNEQKLDTLYQPTKHTSSCLHTVSHTKLGPCLLFQWKPENSNGWIMTADFVPVFKVKGTTMDLFKEVLTTLLQKNPPGWREYTDTLYRRDIILPEVFQTQSTEVKEVAIKLLNYSDENNYIIRPAQEAGIADLQSNKVLLQTYLHIKALKSVLQIEAKSYMVKKVLFLPEFSKRARAGNLLEDPKKLKTEWQKLLFDVLNYPELRKSFGTKIDYEKWHMNQTQRGIGQEELERAISKIPLIKNIIIN